MKWVIQTLREGFRVVEVPDDFDEDNDEFPPEVNDLPVLKTLDEAKAEYLVKMFPPASVQDDGDVADEDYRDDGDGEADDDYPEAPCVLCGEGTSTRCAGCKTAICGHHPEPCPNRCDTPRP
jgi:hypothetical protein